MSLEHQIQSIFFSIAYGLLISLFFNMFYKFLFKSKFFIKIAFSFLFVFFTFSIYFYLLLKINNGIINNYFLLSIILGFSIGNTKTKKIRYKKT